jgi:hypothetical protein
MFDIILKRKVYEDILKWKQEYAPNYVLFLKGARRVGKTTLAELVGKNEYESYMKISFDNASSVVKDMFVEELNNLNLFYQKLQSIYSKKLFIRKSLIILDEIQLFPEARQALKTLLEDGRYDFIETGSLAGITRKSKKMLIPSEEYTIDVLPLDFEEFLWAMNDVFTIDVLKEHYESLKPFGQLRKEYMNKFREYMLVGGMPQAVVKYIETKDFEKVDFVKKTIINLYRNDIEEQKETNSTYVSSFFDMIPSELSKHDKVFKLVHIGKNARMREYGEPINWLDEAMIVNIAHNSTDPSVALNLNLTDTTFKCYLMDTGLLVTLTYDTGSYLDNEIYKAILLDKLHVNEGMILENIVAQALRSKGEKMYFYTKTDKDKKTTIMEIDFVIRRNKKIIPIEVKSGDKFTTVSLRKYKQMFTNRIGVQYVLYNGDIKTEGEIIYLPYFMISVI